MDDDPPTTFRDQSFNGPDEAWPGPFVECPIHYHDNSVVLVGYPQLEVRVHLQARLGSRAFVLLLEYRLAADSSGIVHSFIVPTSGGSR